MVNNLAPHYGNLEIKRQVLKVPDSSPIPFNLDPRLKPNDGYEYLAEGDAAGDAYFGKKEMRQSLECPGKPGRCHLN